MSLCGIGEQEYVLLAHLSVNGRSCMISDLNGFGPFNNKCLCIHAIWFQCIQFIRSLLMASDGCCTTGVDQIRLCICTGWSGPILVANAKRLIFLQQHSNHRSGLIGQAIPSLQREWLNHCRMEDSIFLFRCGLMPCQPLWVILLCLLKKGWKVEK